MPSDRSSLAWITRSIYSLLLTTLGVLLYSAQPFTNIMRAQLAQRLRGRGRSNSLNTVPPPRDSPNYLPELARIAARILYRSPIPSQAGLPIYILNAAAFPDDFDVDYDSLLPYVLERLPKEDELLSGTNYEVIFFAGGQSDGATTTKKSRPSWPWFINAYQILSRALRKRVQKLYVVHTRSWVRILVEMFSTIVSPKSRRKIVHVSTISQLALQMPIEDLLIPPSAYLYDRQVSTSIYAPYATGKRAFSAQNPLPYNVSGEMRLPRVLRETTSFIMLEDNIRTEGLFRIPPNSRLKDILKEAYDRGQKFIVWKESNTMLALPVYPEAQGSANILTAIEPGDAYGVHLAASLIKAWYADLRYPLIPRSSYADIRKIFGEREASYPMERLTELVSPKSGFPMLPATSREIMTRHLLPLLSTVAAYEDFNKMNAENLAVCFAPAMLCGEDPMEDAKMSSVVRAILIAATEQWNQGLREACGVEEGDFVHYLQSPSQLSDYEDQLDNGRIVSGSAAYYDAQKQASGIILEDRDQAGEGGPPLPPRPAPPYRPDQLTGWTDQPSATQPAPRLSVPPPRYSTVIAQDFEGVQESPTSYNADAAAITNGFSSLRSESGSSPSNGVKQLTDPPQVSVIKRKPNPEQRRDANAKESQSRSTSGSEARSVSAMLAGQAAELLKRKPVSSSASITPISPIASTNDLSRLPGNGMSEVTVRQADVGSEPPSASDASTFRKPSWPASSRPPVVNTLARPIVPGGGTKSSPQESPTLTTPTVPRRMPSPSLLERMSSFESKSSTKSELKPPQRLNLKKASVDDLRKLYEERVGTAKTLVEAGSGRRGSQGTLSRDEHSLSRATTS